MNNGNKLRKSQTVAVGSLMRESFRRSGIADAVNTQLVFAAWDKVSGAGAYTSRKFYRSGKLYVTLSSSVVRSQLSFLKDDIRRSINKSLSESILFSPGESQDKYVNEIILK